MRGTKGKKRLAAFLLAVVMMLTYSPEGAAMAAEAWKEKGSFQLISVNPKQNPAAADLQEEGEEETGEPETQTEEAEEPGQQIQENPVLTLEEREEERLAVVRAELEALVQQGFSADAFAPFLIIDNEGEESAFLESEASDSGNPLKIDEMVLAAQQWLNETYTGQHGYTPVEENGKTGNNVVRGLITALQIEL